MITLGLSYDENMFVDKTELASITKCKIGIILKNILMEQLKERKITENILARSKNGTF